MYRGAQVSENPENDTVKHQERQRENIWTEMVKERTEEWQLESCKSTNQLLKTCSTESQQIINQMKNVICFNLIFFEKMTARITCEHTPTQNVE